VNRCGEARVAIHQKRFALRVPPCPVGDEKRNVHIDFVRETGELDFNRVADVDEENPIAALPRQGVSRRCFDAMRNENKFTQQLDPITGAPSGQTAGGYGPMMLAEWAFMAA